ncbi:na+ solute symporter isoform B [Micractinium conductrix]|uniref:Na+ solute symporter isoform A n=1 Tax=Micractinium conductrix TaxID=554055 RepID=A0A2P6VG84_9CHLO|nr:na+ solute symporter isoform A [Micractinium conductrix]PSC73101.1 na+ solute symporter isoform B [Micractinium conductrix]|eukprot:PSC73100.1 na+ solute symporter isoform A [Micractinium conductrix]
MDLKGYQVLTWSLTAVLLASFAGFALIFAYLRKRRLSGSVNFNQEEFITARRQVGALRIGWSFFAGALGAWVISSPPSYTGSGFGYGAGAIGLAFYSLSSGLPVIMIAFAGDLIRRKVPHVLSLTDFMGWRYGWVAKTYVVILCLLDMSIAILAEYTSIGTLFGVYLGSKAYAITICVGILTLIYTTYGGLYISIITDQIQGVAVCLLFSICVIYMAADFRYPLPKPFVDDCAPAFTSEANPQGFCLSGKNKAGYSSIFVMPASLFTATIFSEAMWQRAWASADKRALVRGSFIGCVGIVLVVFFVGLTGILAAWAGLILPGEFGGPDFCEVIEPPTDYNLYFLAALGALNNASQISKWIGVVVMLLAVCMNMSAVDSLQNGLTAGFSSHLLKGKPVSWTKLAVLVINVPLVVLGARPNGLDLKVLDLFLLANMLCCTSAIPVLLGLSEKLHPLLGGASLVFSCLFSFFCTSLYGVDYFYNNFTTIQANDAAGCAFKYQVKDFGNAMKYTWMGNGYSWDFFLIPLSVSLGSMLLCALLNWALQRCTAKPALLGFTAPATHPHLYPAEPAEESEGSDEGKESGSPAKRSSEELAVPAAQEQFATAAQ